MRVKDEATGMTVARLVPVGRLLELLDYIPENALIGVNAVGNLSIIRADLSGQLGHIDIAAESRSSECDLFDDAD